MARVRAGVTRSPPFLNEPQSLRSVAYFLKACFALGSGFGLGLGLGLAVGCALKAARFPGSLEQRCAGWLWLAGMGWLAARWWQEGWWREGWWQEGWWREGWWRHRRMVVARRGEGLSLGVVARGWLRVLARAPMWAPDALREEHPNVCAYTADEFSTGWLADAPPRWRLLR